MRWIACFLAAVMVLLAFLPACGGSSPTPTRPPLASPLVAMASPTAKPGLTPTATAIKLTTRKFYRVGGTEGQGLNVRLTPEVTGKVVAQVCEGAVIEVEGDPIKGGQYMWVYVVGYGYAADMFLVTTSGPATSKVSTQGDVKVICAN